ncbi:putative orfan [Tupanvirus soda lake]|uniref:Orfan n=2 Tax=Tupanvirus TaxID=2094720 RepID=A0AC62AB53_9VIRU|nr:putative orfan [Tupanvirus soda lake]QKU34964.1 putative orfan [Tupanvirus soda lake]
MASYIKIKRYLDNFYKQVDIGERNASHNIFYQFNDLIINNNTHFYILCQKSFGNGDILNGIKTYMILKKYFTNVFLLIKNSKDYESTYKMTKGNIKITTLQSLYFMYDLKQKKQIQKIFIACALPVYTERFNNIPGPKRYLFIDEYNGWRIQYMENDDKKSENNKIIENDNENQSNSDNSNNSDSEDSNDSENSDVELKENHKCNKLECEQCLKNEHYVSYGMWKKIKSQPEDFKSYYISSGFGKTENSIPTIGVHIMEEHFETISNDLVKFYLEKIKGDKFYFAYFSTIRKKKDKSFVFLQRFYETIIGLNNGKSTNIIIVDSRGYLYRNNKISFVKDDTVEFHENGCFIINKINNTKILYLNYLCHTDMIGLMKLSEPLILLSGDQSFIEGISLQLMKTTKIIFYQIQSWKLNLIQQFMKISENILPPDSILLHLQKIIYNYEPDTVFPTAAVVSMISENIEVLIKESALVYKYILCQYNIQNILVSLCLRIMYEDNTTIEMINNMLYLYHNNKCFKNEYYKLITYINDKHVVKSFKRKISEKKKAKFVSNKKIKLV